MKYKNNEPFVKVINPLQVKLYTKHGVKPTDIYYNKYTDKVVFVYKISETKDLYKLWNKRLLK